MMGIGGVSLGSVLVVLLVVLLIFGTKRLRHIGEDLGNALKSFRKGMDDEQNTTPKQKNKRKK